MDTVDTITAPAMVIPWNINSKSYIETDNKRRGTLGFYSIPFEFLCRDDWADIHEQGKRATAQGVNTQVYEEASKSERKLLLNNLLQQYPIQKQKINKVKDNFMKEYFEEKDEEEEEEEEDDDDDDDDDDDAPALQGRGNVGGRRGAGTQFAFFTSTKVHILTEEIRKDLQMAATGRGGARRAQEKQ